MKKLQDLIKQNYNLDDQTNRVSKEISNICECVSEVMWSKCLKELIKVGSTVKSSRYSIFREKITYT